MFGTKKKNVTSFEMKRRENSGMEETSVAVGSTRFHRDNIAMRESVGVQYLECRPQGDRRGSSDRQL